MRPKASRSSGKSSTSKKPGAKRKQAQRHKRRDVKRAAAVQASEPEFAALGEPPAYQTRRGEPLLNVAHWAVEDLQRVAPSMRMAWLDRLGRLVEPRLQAALESKTPKVGASGLRTFRLLLAEHAKLVKVQVELMCRAMDAKAALENSKLQAEVDRREATEEGGLQPEDVVNITALIDEVVDQAVAKALAAAASG